MELRPAFDALFAIDDAMGEVVARATEPALAAIKLAWWREQLEGLDDGKVPAEPRLQAAADELLTRRISGARLAELEDGWIALLEEKTDPERAVTRGATLFDMASGLLGATDPMIETAGRLYILERIARLGMAKLTGVEVDLRHLAGHRFGVRLRPLTALAALAARDAKQARLIEPEGTPGRALALLKHRFTGRII